MRKSLIVLISLSTVCIYLQFRTIKPDLFLEEIYAHLPLLLLIFLTIRVVFKDANRYKTTRENSSFLPTIVGSSAIIIIVSSMWYRSDEGYGKTLFKAYNDRVSHGVDLDFKRNNNLKITQTHRIGTTTYWGTYKRDRDTFLLSIDLDFELGNKAVLKNDTLLTFLSTGLLFKVDRYKENEAGIIITDVD